MENIRFTKKENAIRNWLGVPFSVFTIFVALVYSEEGWWAYWGILLVGNYLYILLYWKLYQRFMLDVDNKEIIKFSSYLIGFQFLLIGSVVLVYIGFE